MDRISFLSKFRFRVIPCWHNQKIPRMEDWLNRATYDPTIVGNYGVLASGSPYGDGTIVVVDLDNHNEEEESGVEFWQRNKLPSDTFTVSTPSGGKHLYFVASPTQIDIIKMVGGQKLHKQVDFFWQQNHYVMGVGSSIDGKHYEVVNESEPMALPEVVIGLLCDYRGQTEQPVGKPHKGVSLNPYEKELILRTLEEDPGLIEDYDDWLSMMAAFKNSGFDVEAFKRVSWQDEKTQRSIEYKWRSLSHRENEATFGSIIYKVVPQWNDLQWRFDRIEDMAIEAAVSMYPMLHKVLIGKDVCIIDESVRDRGTVRDYKNTYACYQDKGHRMDYPVLNYKEKKIVLQTTDSFPVWFKNAPLLEGRVCEPSHPFGEIECAGVRLFNDWEEPTLKDGDGTTELFWQHIRDNVCDGNEECFTYFRNWIYDLLANPLHRNGVAVAISGNQGCGKSIVGNILSRCFHPKYVSTLNNSEQLGNKFDAGWKNSILVCLEESCFAGERKNGVWSKMKDLITSSETTLERKGVDVEHIRNKLHFLITSNESYIVPKQQGDRRYLVLHCNDNHRCDSEYFGDMVSQMENGGCLKLLQEAREHREDALGFNYLSIPETDLGTENLLETAPMPLRVLVSKIEEYRPENGDLDMPFAVVGGEILVNASKLIDVLPKRDEYLTPKKVGRWLSEWLGKQSEDRRIPYPVEDKTMKCFVFEDINAVKRSITQQYFNGIDVFK